MSARDEFAAIDLKPRIGSEIRIDLATLLRGARAPEIRRLLEERGVLAFREIDLSDGEQVAFTKTLGHIVDEGENNIHKITMDTAENAQADYLKGAFLWHIDGTMSEVPILASILSGRRLSSTGGETEFANTYAAYDDLPESEKRAFEKLRVVHMLEVSQRYWHPEPSYAELKTWQRNALDSGRMMHRTKLHGEEPFA